MMVVECHKEIAVLDSWVGLDQMVQALVGISPLPFWMPLISCLDLSFHIFPATLLIADG